MPSRKQSEQIYQRLCHRIPGGVNSPVRACRSVGLTPPIVAAWGKGDLIGDEDGRTFIDYCGSWGALLHGHAPETVVEAASLQLQCGSTFGMTTKLEAELAEKIAGHIPAMEQMRFVSSGTEATMSAARLARAYTGKEYIVKFAGHFHGHADLFLVQAGSGVLELSSTASSKGVPEAVIQQTLVAPFNREEACLQLFSDARYRNKIAAVILEPIAANMGVVPGNTAFLRFLRRETEKMGALLIFDEVITGFRVGLGGVQGMLGIQPDLTTLGKIIGGGLPAAAFGGKREIMQWLAPIGPVYQSGTLSGNPIAMAAGKEAIRLAEQEGFYGLLEGKVRKIVDPVQQYIEQHNLLAGIQRVGSMFTLFLGIRSAHDVEGVKLADAAAFAKLFHYLLDRGIYIPPLQQEAWFVSAAHTDAHLEYTAEVILQFLDQVDLGADEFEKSSLTLSANV